MTGESGSRSGFALATTFWAIVAASLALFVAFLLVRQQMQWEVKIQEQADHVYLAEGVLAQEVNRLKARSWHQRWYANTVSGQRPAPANSVQGAPILGQFPRLTGAAGQTVAEYEGYVQDVGDFWSRDPSRRLAYHTDIFLKVSYPVTYPRTSDQPAPEERHFFYRAVFRPPSVERPSTLSVRRFVRVPAFQPSRPESRAEILCLVEEDERAREANRPQAKVLEREILALTRGGVPLGQIARALSPRPAVATGFLPAAVACTTDEERARESQRPAAAAEERAASHDHRTDGSLSMQDIARLLKGDGTLVRQIELETQIQDALTNGQRVMATRGDLAVARTEFARAFAVARSQDAANSAYTIPQAQNALAWAEWFYARTLKRTGAEAVERRDLIDSARARWQEIIRAYPWRDITFGDRLEAPHAYAPLALSRVDRADPANRAETAAAVGEANTLLEELRRAYPYFHLWDEDAITGRTHTGDSLPTDEVVYFLRQLTPRQLVALAGQISSKAHPAIQRWISTPGPAGRWFEAGRLVVPRLAATGVMVRPVRGRVMADQVLIFDGSQRGPIAEYYDVATNRSRGVDAAVAPAMGRTGLMIDDRTVLLFGGADPVWTGSQWQVGTWSVTSQLFDTVNETFRTGEGTQALGGDLSCCLLPDGRVLGVGTSRLAAPAATAEIYDPRTGRFTRVPNAPDGWRRHSSLTVLDDGSVLFTGGANARAYSETLSSPGTAHLFFPDKNRFWPGNPPATAADIAPWPATPMGEMTHYRALQTASKLPDGRVLVANGYIEGAGGPASQFFDDTEIFDPATRTFSTSLRTVGRLSNRSAVTLADGRVILSGGRGQSRTLTAAETEMYDPATGLFSSLAPMAVPFSGHLTFELTAGLP